MTEGPDLIAEEIAKVGEAARKLLSSKLSRRAVLVLLKDQTGISHVTIGKVLDAAANLGAAYTKR